MADQIVYIYIKTNRTRQDGSRTVEPGRWGCPGPAGLPSGCSSQPLLLSLLLKLFYSHCASFRHVRVLRHRDHAHTPPCSSVRRYRFSPGLLLSNPVRFDSVRFRCTLSLVNRRPRRECAVRVSSHQRKGYNHWPAQLPAGALRRGC